MSETTTTVQNPTGFGESLSHIDRINGLDNPAAVPGIRASAGQPFHLTEDAFDMMTDEQNERLLTALESIAGSLEKATTPRPVPLQPSNPPRMINPEAPHQAQQPPKPAEVKEPAKPVEPPAPAPEPAPAAPTLHPAG